MTSSLSTTPGSSTKLQHQTLVMAGKDKGFELNAIRKMVGGSLRRLSAAKCSEWITHFSGKGLANPPGQKPGVYKGKRKPGTIRMITEDQVDQIERLGLEYFATASDFARWLARDFDCEIRWRMGEPIGTEIKEQIRRLATAERAGQVIRVLKIMQTRRSDVATKRRRVGHRPTIPSRDRKGAEPRTEN